MFRTVMISCAVLLVGTLSYYGANEASAPADFAFVNQGQAYTLDPQQMSWSSDHRICFNVWEGLTTIDATTLEPIAGMAHFPPDISADELSYTFHLRSDSAWCNGDRVTAGDFVRGWRRALEPGTASDYAFLLLDHVAGTRDYYDWRNRAVELLGKMKSLARCRNDKGEHGDSDSAQQRSAPSSLSGGAHHHRGHSGPCSPGPRHTGPCLRRMGLDRSHSPGHFADIPSRAQVLSRHAKCTAWRARPGHRVGFRAGFPYRLTVRTKDD